MLIVAEDLESELLNMLIINKHRAGLKVRSLCFSIKMDIFFWILQSSYSFLHGNGINNHHRISFVLKIRL